MSLSKDRLRVDETGRAYAGSQRQIQTYVNEHPVELSRAMSVSLGLNGIDQSILWVSPLATQSYREYRDNDFLDALGLGQFAGAMRRFWPRGGPCWDALARITGGGCILVEAKSHLPEIYGSGCGASQVSLPFDTTRVYCWGSAVPVR